MSELKAQIESDMKDAMRARDKERLGTIRLLLAAVKQREIDSQTKLDDAGVLGVIDKMIKQRRDSATQYTDAGRLELAAQENLEIEHLQKYMPQALSDTEIEQIIHDALKATGASGMKDMGRVMGIIKPKVQGRADMSALSKTIKDKLA